MEIDFLDRASIHRLSFNMLNVADQRGQSALGVADNAVRHFLRGQALVLPDDADDGNVDVRQNVDRRAQNHDRAENKNQQRHHNECVRAPQRQSNDPHRLISCPVVMAVYRSSEPSTLTCYH